MQPGVSDVVHSWHCAWNYFGLNDRKCQSSAFWILFSKISFSLFHGVAPSIYMNNSSTYRILVRQIWQKMKFAAETCWNPLKCFMREAESRITVFFSIWNNCNGFYSTDWIVPWGQAQATHVILWWQPVQPVTENKASYGSGNVA